MDEIAILGAGGLAREVAQLIGQINAERPRWRVVAFVAKFDSTSPRAIGGVPVIDDRDFERRDLALAIGVGEPALRGRLVERYTGAAFPNLIHPTVALDASDVTLGEGNIICRGSIFTTAISIGSYNYFNIGCTYGHDCRFADCSVINPGVNVSGAVTVGDRCLLGTGATILQGLSIGDAATVGAGAVVTKNVAAGSVVVGVPAVPRVS
ncbi:MAG: acetyltransferase [Deltaproteobacteria bacterium]|nr:acetyltransferase [Deltaproteobacteria bacterium]